MRRKGSPSSRPEARSRSAGPRAPGRAREEIVVVGSGVVGAACAAALARAGHRVRVLSTPGRSTTSVSGGHLLLQSKQPGPVLDLALRSLELLGAFVAGREADLGYRQAGSLLLAAGEGEVEALREHFDALWAVGLPLEWQEGATTRALEPELAPGVLAASFCPLDAQVDPSALAGAWLQEAVEHRTAVTSGPPVESFVRSAGRVCGVVAGQVEFPASAVVLAAGPWSGELARMAGVDLDLQPRRGVLLRAPSERTLAGRPLLGAGYLAAKFGAQPEAPGPQSESSVAFSFQQHPDGECVLGGTREFVEWSEEGLEAAARAVLAEAVRYLPAVGELAWGAPRCGFRPWVPDGQPRIGPSEVPGLYLACGFEGDGITLAAAAAERLAACF